MSLFKLPSQREARELCAKAKSIGAYYLVIYRKSGKPEVARFGPVDRDDADALFNGWVLGNRKKKRKSPRPASGGGRKRAC